MIKRFTAPVDKIAIALFFTLTLLSSILLWGGEQLLEFHPEVQEFSWRGETIGADNRAFILSFNRPMDRDAVAKNLTLDPPLPGKISWAGRKMAYTLETPAPYGETYEVTLAGAREQFFNGELGEEMQPFRGLFSSRDRAFAYIGVEGEETGRLILYNLTQQEKTILTPPDLVVTRLEPYSAGNRILFAAVDQKQWRKGLAEEKLYAIPTGLNQKREEGLELILNNQDYRNLSFDLSQDGQTIVVQRIDRNNPANFGLWTVQPDSPPQPLDTPTGGEFLIAPDSQTLALTQGEGVAIIPLDDPTAETDALDFLPQYAQILSFSKDGTAAAMVNFNTDNPDLLYTRSLYLVNNQNVEQKLLDTDGSILDCQFNPSNTLLYCLVTDLEDDSQAYVEKPYLVAIDLDTYQAVKLAMFPEQIDIQMSMSPDGVALLFDQIVRDPDLNDPTVMRTSGGEPIVTSRMWLLPVSPLALPSPQETQLVELPLPGFRPQWLP